jgi:hypothetical protein
LHSPFRIHHPICGPFLVRSLATLEAGADSEDTLARLQSIPGLTVVGEVASPFPGTRFFRLYFEQPADHRRPNGERFLMRATLLHRSVDAPVVLYSGGYSLGGFPFQYEPTALLGANQIALEHRFFGTSRPELLPFVESLAADAEDSFGLIGLDRTLEFAVVEMPFYFWQYGDASYCAEIPAPGAPAEEAFAFLEGVVGLVYTYGDAALDVFAAYYYQSATEIGWNAYPTRHLRGLLRYPRQDVPTAYLPFPVEERFDHGLMLRVEHWVRHQGERMLFLYVQERSRL